MEELGSIAALVGLLHDIGKFALRSGVSSSRPSDADAGRDFVEACVPAVWRAGVRAAAGGHHKPESRLEGAVALAGRLSAGERAEVDVDEAKLQPLQLLSIFHSIEADEQRSPGKVYWSLNPLKLDEETVFPGPALAAGQIQERYARLWHDFEHEASALAAAFSVEGADIESYLESMLLLVQRYGWCVPSAYFQTQPDVSLYDHARVTAALAAIFQDEAFNRDLLKQMLENPHQSSEPAALLVGGDLSGVQSFLYTISARGATSALRGRSFYLALLTEAAARYTLRRLNLPVTNLIYQGGGNFYLLARPTDGEKLAEIQNEIGRELFAAHRGDLSMSLGWVELQARDFYDGQISQQWGSLTDQLQQAKLRRFAGFGAGLPAVFAPEGHGGNEDQSCSVCGAEDPNIHKERREDGEEVRKCRACASYEKLGDELRNARYLVWSFREPAIPTNPQAQSPMPYTDVLVALGMEPSLSKSVPSQLSGSRSLVLALRDESLASLRPSAHVAIGRKLLVNVTPLVSHKDYDALKSIMSDLPEVAQIKPFDVLEHQSSGIKRLGVLRMDVDNLGHIFSRGLGKGATLARVASLSFAISLYFEGWVGVLAERLNRELPPLHSTDSTDRLYSIYAGGDDLFFTGSWDAVVELSRLIRIDITRFSGGHPGIHASAGIVLSGGKYPLAQAALDAGQAESQAKRLRWMHNGQFHQKDAICFLGQSIAWKRFGLSPQGVEDSETVQSLMHYLSEREKLHPLLRRLINFQEMYQEEMEDRRKKGLDLTRDGKPQVLYGRWNWLAAYTLERAIRQAGDVEVRRDLQKLDAELQENQFSNIDWIGLAARWAELFTR